MISINTITFLKLLIASSEDNFPNLTNNDWAVMTSLSAILTPIHQASLCAQVILDEKYVVVSFLLRKGMSAVLRSFPLSTSSSESWRL